MSDDKKTTETEATNTEAAEVTTRNSHATSNPLKTKVLGSDENTGDVKPDNSHATGEPV